jgi:hypothetical protein
MIDWDIEPGTTLVRRELHDRWGGGWYGGMEPAPRAESVFLFTKPSAGAAFGYTYDGWRSDGTFQYTGDGQVGDQSPDEGGNRALLQAARQGRTIRLFRSVGVNTTYLGAFELTAEPYYRADAPDRDDAMRSVLVFRLAPLGEVVRDPLDGGPAENTGPLELALEASNIEAYIAARPNEPALAVRREAELVRQYAAWLEEQGHSSVRHLVPLPGGASMYTDVFDKTASELIEAKASSARTYIRTGLGQILDYARYVAHSKRSLLLPTRPGNDLVELLMSHRVNVIYRVGSAFQRIDAPTS